ncbi:hypothetical protein [Caballeronia sp. BCC1704]|uniref:hypothetical protein n=1 Tax=Caballeronia sp. BCC1704 TaxID=2676300 RepID=UPI00158ED8CF|nr:hypothetical protein [Caballeronia sp. BCC1704]
MKTDRMRKAFIMAAAVVGTAFMPISGMAGNPTPNPYLSAPKGAMTHFDPAQTDAFTQAIPAGTRTAYGPLGVTPQASNGFLNFVTLKSTSPDYVWAVSSTGVSYLKVANDAVTQMGATLAFPGAVVVAQNLLTAVLTQPFTTVQQVQAALQSLGLLTAGQSLGPAYSLVDADNVLYSGAVNSIVAVGLISPDVPALGVRILRSMPSSAFVQSGESVTGLSLTYDGKLVVQGTRSVSVVDRNFNSTPQTLRFGSDETISNSLAIDENNGIYIVSDKKMHKVIWTGSVLSNQSTDGAWESPYPTGDTYPTLFGSGSGSTPTLMGFGSDPDKLVVITDGLKRMSLIAFWRDAIPSGFTNRIAGQIPVTAGLPPDTETIQSDQSVTVDGYGAFVVNNVGPGGLRDSIGTIIPDAIARGPILDSPLGVERFEWNPSTHSWASVWARGDISSNTMIPGKSIASNTVFVSGYYRTNNSGWEITGLDWNTGQTVHRTILGTSIYGNGMYAPIEFLPDGDLFFNGILGFIRVQLPSGLVYPAGLPL